MFYVLPGCYTLPPPAIVGRLSCESLFLLIDYSSRACDFLWFPSDELNYPTYMEVSLLMASWAVPAIPISFSCKTFVQEYPSGGMDRRDAFKSVDSVGVLSESSLFTDISY